jgi:hypothetical protein
MSLEAAFDEYRRLMKGDVADVADKMNRLRRGLSERCQQLQADDARWVFARISASDRGTKGFIGAILEFARGLPDAWMEPLVQAGVNEFDPSHNELFIAPAVREFGFEQVARRLLQYLTNGTNFEKAGAVNAFYWVLVHGARNASVVAGVRQEFRDQCLVEFVENSDVDVRRSIVASLCTDEAMYSDGIRHLLGRAISIARSHSDEYIRHRIEIQMGNRLAIPPLPHRAEDESN